jgi:NYN domain-containing protein
MSNNKKAAARITQGIAEPADVQSHLAVLIDADNASAAIIDGLFAEIAKYGVASVKRIYGDWTQPHLGGWKKVLLDYSIQPVQQFGYTTGKNATDSALIIDAMDLLYTRRFNGFCLVSSDSDFTRLAARIRGRASGFRIRGEEDARGFRFGLRQVHLHGTAARPRQAFGSSADD